ncbi:MAG: MATE family efflux transporter [bacterium]|nr:MATE family efflux transporter [bacterium]
MEKSEKGLSEKDRKNRDLILHGNMWTVVFKMCAPLALYQSLNQLFKILDTQMAAHISSTSVSAVAYLSQISLMLSALGGGLAVGASLKVSEAYGAGDYELVKKRVSSLYMMCVAIGAVVLIGILPFTRQFLRMANTPETLIDVGQKYFVIDLISMVIMFFNNVYISIERVRGNSKRILYLNMIVIFVKLSITALFVYVLHGNITSIAFATLLSQLALFAFAIINSSKKGNLFSFSLKAISLKKKVNAPMIFSSIPVIMEKVLFAFGKVVVNSMSTSYGDLTVGALGVSNNIGGITTSPQNGFQEGGAAIISQNLGAKNYARALDAFKKVMIFNVSIGVLGYSITTIWLSQISEIFAKNDPVFHQMIIHIYSYEALGAVMLGINASILALLYGYGLMRYTFIINVSRVFVFRIPVLWGLQRFTNIGNESVGIVMMVSNVATGVFALLVMAHVLIKIKKNTLHGYDFMDESVAA